MNSLFPVSSSSKLIAEPPSKKLKPNNSRTFVRVDDGVPWCIVASFLSSKDMGSLFSANRFLSSKKEESLDWIRIKYGEESKKNYQQIRPEIISKLFSKTWTLENFLQSQREAVKRLFDEILKNDPKALQKSSFPSCFSLFKEEHKARGTLVNQGKEKDLETIKQLIEEDFFFAAERCSSFIQDEGVQVCAKKLVAQDSFSREFFEESIKAIESLTAMDHIEQCVKTLFKNFNGSSIQLEIIVRFRFSSKDQSVRNVIYTNLIEKLSFEGNLDRAFSLLNKIKGENSDFYKKEALEALAKAYAKRGNFPKILELSDLSSSLNGKNRIFEFAAKGFVDFNFFDFSLEAISRISHRQVALRAYLHLVKVLLKKKDLEKVDKILKKLFLESPLTLEGNVRILEKVFCSGNTNMVLNFIESRKDTKEKINYYFGISDQLKSQEKFKALEMLLKGVQEQPVLYFVLNGYLFWDRLPKETISSLMDLILDPNWKDQTIDNLYESFLGPEKFPIFQELIPKCTGKKLKEKLFMDVLSFYVNLEELSSKGKLIKDLLKLVNFDLRQEAIDAPRRLPADVRVLNIFSRENSQRKHRRMYL